MAPRRLVGQRLGKYRITGVLGEGGMGVVYAGEDLQLRRPVAIKFLTAAASVAPASRRRFLREARSAARLSHANVVAIYDMGAEGDDCYLVLEFVHGKSAQAILQARGPLPWPEATRLAADVCLGLAAAHAAGILHRDVKPANVLLTEAGAAKLTDFGLARPTAPDGSSLTTEQTLLGTAHFMSPEQCSGDRLDERTDLYSLGATYFALLTGRPPFDEPNRVKALYAHCSAPVPSARALVPALPEGCDGVIRKAMAKSRGDRFGSAGEMGAALLALLPEAPPTPKPAPPTSAAPIGATASGAAALDRTRSGSVGAGKPRKRRWRVLLVLAILATAALAPLPWLADRTGPGDSTAPGDPAAPDEQPAPRSGEVVRRAPASGPMPQFRLRSDKPKDHGGKDVRAVHFAAGRLVTAGADGWAYLYEVNALDEPRHHLNYKDALYAAALSPDGALLAIGGQSRISPTGTVDLFRTDGKFVQAIRNLPHGVRALAFSPSGKRLAIATAKSLHLYAVAVEPKPKLKVRTDLLSDLGEEVTAVAFAPGDEHLAAVTNNGRAFLWDLRRALEGYPKQRLPGALPTALTGVAFSADGTRLAVASDGATKNVHHGRALVYGPDFTKDPVLLGENPKDTSMTCIAAAPGPARFAFSGGWGRLVQLRDAVTGKGAGAGPPVDDAPRAMCFSPDGKLLAVGFSRGAVRLWDVLPGEPAKE
jgi:WD40 repeat protein